MFCTNCGAQMPDGSKFCTACGAPLREKAPSSGADPAAGSAGSPATPEETATQENAGTADVAGTAGTDFCTNCGAPIEPGCNFCTACGHRVGELPKVARAEASRAAASATGTMPSQPLQPQPQAVAAPQAQQADRTSTPIIVVCAVVIALAGLVIAHYFGFMADAQALAFLPTQTQQVSTATSADASASTTQTAAPAQEADASVPNVIGQPQSDAVTSLQQAGFSVGSVTQQQSNQTKGVVVSQSVTGTAKKGTSIDLVVSKGSQKHKTFTIVHQPMTWTEAEAYCEQHGGHLACINSQDEWDQAKAAMAANDHDIYWIGGRIQNGSFAWVDGSDFSFSEWAAGEPNNENGDENYLVVYRVDGVYAWYDAPNDISSFYKSTALGFLMETYE